MPRLFRLLPVFLLSGTLVAPLAARAQSLANVGYVSGTQDVLSSLTLADGRIAQRILFQATVTTDDPENPYNLVTQDCFATYIFDADTPVAGYGTCDGISSDGDIFWLSVGIGDDGVIHWKSAGGTGSFAGMETSGTTEMLTQWDDGKFIGRFEGIYTRK